MENSVTQSPKMMDVEAAFETVTSRLARKQKQLNFELAQVNAALDAMSAHPEVAQVLNLVSKAVRI